MNKVYGFDIAKKSFVGYGHFGSSVCLNSFRNDGFGFSSLIAQLSPDSICLMEASGPYYLALATALYEAGMRVFVLNPLVIRRYCQMQLTRAKTDAVDARLIYQYAQQYYLDLSPWEPPKAVYAQLRQLNTALSQLHKQLRMVQNQQEAFGCEADQDPVVFAQQEQLVKQLKSAIKALEQQMQTLCQTHCKDTYDCLLSIPGIGPKSAALLITLTHEFDRFDSPKKLASYLGFCPRIFQSGTSIKGRESIVKMGQSLARSCLYMAAYAAMKYNPECVKLAERMKEKGKHYRTIRVAVAHKLLRQAFSIGKTKTHFKTENTGTFI